MRERKKFEFVSHEAMIHLLSNEEISCFFYAKIAVLRAVNVLNCLRGRAVHIVDAGRVM